MRRSTGSRSRSRSIVFTVFVIAFLAVAATFHRATMVEAAHQLRTLSVGSLLVILAAVALHRIFQAALTSATTGNLSLSRSFISNEAYAACNNATVGGGAVGTGVRVAMMRDWGLTGEEIATSITAISVFPAIALWFVAMLGGIWMWTSGLAQPIHLLVIAVGFSLSIGPVVFWSIVLRSPRWVNFLARYMGRSMAFVRRSRIVRRLTPRRLNTALDQLDMVVQGEKLRVTAAPLLGRQGFVAMVCALGNQATLSLILLSTLSGLGALSHPASLSDDGLVVRTLAPLGVIAVFSMARTLATFAPVPGGLGMVDAGLLSGLIAIGAQRPTAIAAIGLFRAVTFVLPLITGPITMMFYRRSLARRQRAARPLGSAELVGASTVEGVLGTLLTSPLTSPLTAPPSGFGEAT
jgi:putative heme transporter